MQIKITEIRQIKDGEYWDWAKAVMQTLNLKLEDEKRGLALQGIILSGRPLTKDDFKILLNTGKMILKEDYGYTEMTTLFEIMR